jgi:HAD superfamily hydrolase (TIGR01509 family)
MLKNTVIFDFDGVIIDSEPLRYETYRQLFQTEFGVKLPVKDIDFLGRGQSQNLKYFMSMFNLNGDLDKLILKRNRLINDAFSRSENIKPIKGLKKLLDYLQDKNLIIAIASSSNKSYIEDILRRLKLDCFFKEIITGEMVTKGKPSPEIFLLAAERLKVQKENCIVIEDSINGIKAAKSASMEVYAITSSLKKESLTIADEVIDNLSEVIYLLEDRYSI